MEEAEGKSFLASKTLHFNTWSVVLIHAVWPMIPKHFRNEPYAMSALSAYFAIVNSALRFVTTEAISWRRRDK
jgi:hypothetical protein